MIFSGRISSIPSSKKKSASSTALAYTMSSNVILQMKAALDYHLSAYS